MQCHKVVDLLSGYIDGMLEPSQLSQVREHLTGCTDCRMKYEKIKEAIDLVKGLPEVMPPEGFHEQLFSRLQSIAKPEKLVESHRHARRSFFRKKLTGVMALAAILLIGVGFSLWYSGYGGLSRGIISDNAGNQIAEYGKHNVSESEPQQSLKKETALNSEQELIQNEQRDVAPQSAFADQILPGTGESSPTEAATEKQASQEQVSALPVAGGVNGESPNTDELVDASTENSVAETEMLSIPNDYDSTMGSGGTLAPSAVSSKADTGVHEAKEVKLRLILNQSGDVSAWQSALERSGGFIQNRPQQDGGPWVLRIPAASTESFINDLNRLGLTEVQTTTDLGEQTGLSKITLYIE